MDKARATHSTLHSLISAPFQVTKPRMNCLTDKPCQMKYPDDSATTTHPPTASPSHLELEGVVMAHHPPQTTSFSFAGRRPPWGPIHQRVPVILAEMSSSQVSPTVIRVAESMGESMVFVYFLNHRRPPIVALIRYTVAVAGEMC